MARAKQTKPATRRPATRKPATRKKERLPELGDNVYYVVSKEVMDDKNGQRKVIYVYRSAKVIGIPWPGQPNVVNLWVFWDVRDNPKDRSDRIPDVQYSTRPLNREVLATWRFREDA